MTQLQQLSPLEKAEREAVNTASQLEYIEYLITTYSISDIRESHVLELHSLAIQEIYNCGGQYRNARNEIHISQSHHTVPEAASITSHIQELLELSNRPELECELRAAMLLWRFNWIHPFQGGNGRTARALSYLILCIGIFEDGPTVLPGDNTVPSYICDNRDRYFDALQGADAHARELPPEKWRDLLEKDRLKSMYSLMKDAVAHQLKSFTDS